MGPTCRICDDTDLFLVETLSSFPISHRLRKSLADPDPRFDIHFHVCSRCGLMQIIDPIDASVLYADAEAYSTAFQRPAHIPDLLNSMTARKDPGSVLEIGCNDGSFLKMMKDRGFDFVVGVEPNRPMAAQGRKEGLDIRTDFFGPATLESFTAQVAGGFDFIVARQVLEHVEMVETFLATVRRGLAPGGIFVLELPHVEAGIECGNPSILWEEHVNYFTEPAIERLLALAGFRVLDRRHYAFGGGTIAFLAARDDALSPIPFATADWSGVSLGVGYYRRFTERLADYKDKLTRLVTFHRDAGGRVAVYGGAPRSCTVINFCGLAATIDLAVDDRAEIQGRFLPGTGRAITGLGGVDLSGPPILFLMGVGSENEFRVRRKIRAELGGDPLAASLFPPRDGVEGFQRALNNSAASSLRKTGDAC